jgi:hypothetical protein
MLNLFHYVSVVRGWSEVWIKSERTMMIPFSLVLQSTSGASHLVQLTIRVIFYRLTAIHTVSLLDY